MNKRDFLKGILAVPLALLKLPESLIMLPKVETIHVPSCQVSPLISVENAHIFPDIEPGTTWNDEGIVEHMVLGPLDSGYCYVTKDGGTGWEKVHP